MDARHFDTLTRSLTAGGSRRRALAAALGGVLSRALGASSREDAAAQNKKKKACPPCKKRKKGKCKKTLPDGTACPGGTCQGGSCIATVVPPPPPPVCAAPDGIKNGTETGVDCGGLCPRCANGQGCTTRDDCHSAFCANNVCQECAPGQCGSDGNGLCGCTIAISSGLFVCRTAKGVANSSCLCPPGTDCFNVMAQDGCYKPCGAP
jgi:hypothetical protein